MATTQATTQKKLRSQDEIDSAAAQLELAAYYAGMTSGPHLTCPSCGTSKRGKVQIRKDRKYVVCHKCGWWQGAINLVKDSRNLSFGEAVDLLNGKTPGAEPADIAARIKDSIAVDDGFRAVEDFELYTWVLNSKHCSLSRAQAYWAHRHISANAVEEQKGRYITDPEKLRDDLVKNFGTERIVAAGLGIETEKGLRLLCGWNYPVIEPALDAKGQVRNMQFRASLKQREKIQAHKNGLGEYVPPFLSIKGAGRRHLVGCGIERLMSIEDAEIVIVEGYADLLAARTMNTEAYAMPGTGIMPPEGVVQALLARGHRFAVAMDGDEAGRTAQVKVIEYLKECGAADDAVRAKEMPDGKDVCDILIERHRTTPRAECRGCATTR